MEGLGEANIFKQLFKLLSQFGIFIEKVSSIFIVSKTEYAGLFAGVGCALVGMGFTRQGLFIFSFIAQANSYQLMALPVLLKLNMVLFVNCVSFTCSTISSIATA